jgi:hypothetical protein
MVLCVSTRVSFVTEIVAHKAEARQNEVTLRAEM